MSATLRPPPAVGRVLEAVWRRYVSARAVDRVAWSAATLLGLAVLLVLTDLAMPLPATTRSVLRWLPPLATATLLALAVRWLRAPLETRRVALLAQEHAPGLENRLATAVELDAPGDSPVRRAFVEETGRALAAAVPGETLRPRARLPLAIAGGAAALLVLAGLAAPALAREAAERWLHPRDAYPQAWRERRAEAAGRQAELPPPPFGELRWEMTPPAYSGLSASQGRGDEPVVALPGSRLIVRSHFSSRWDAVRAIRIGAGAAAVQRGGGEWRIALAVTPEERGLTLEAIAGDTVAARTTLPVAVRPDDPPEVELGEPRQDLVLASPGGRVALAASATDDLGVAGMKLAWSRTRGSGETFEYVDGEWPLPVRPGRRTAAGMTLDLASMSLQPGDVVHLRAVAWDRNDVTGPGESVSRTRTIRIARPEELEQVNTDIGFPIDLPENPLLSQRMIVIRTERLRDRAASLGAAEVRRQAADLAHEQSRLRERVGEQVFTRATEAMQDPFADLSFTETGGAAHAHGEPAEAQPPARTPEQVLEEASEATGQGTMDEVAHRHDAAPILEVNRTLQRLYDLMWSSERELNQASPTGALPHQYEALRLIQEMRRTERRFPRGSIQVDAVDVAAARGTGEMKDVAPARRTTGVPLPDRAAAVAELERVSRSTMGVPRRRAALNISALAQRLLATPGVDAATVALVEESARTLARGDQAAALRLLARARLRLEPAAGRHAVPLATPSDPASIEYFRRLEASP